MRNIDLDVVLLEHNVEMADISAAHLCAILRMLHIDDYDNQKEALIEATDAMLRLRRHYTLVLEAASGIDIKDIEALSIPF